MDNRKKSAKISILQFCTETHIGGTENMLLNLLKHSDKNKFEYYVAAVIPGGQLPSMLKKLNIPFTLFPMRTKINIFSFLTFCIQVIKYLKKHPFNIIHVYGYNLGIIIRIIGKILGIPHIIIGQRSTDDWRKWRHSILDRATSFFVDLYIANSDAAKKLLIQREKINPDKITVIYNGINIPANNDNQKKRIDQFDINKNDIVLGTVANFRYMKGYHYLLEVAPKLIQKYKNIKFFWIGGGPILDSIKKEIESSALSSRIIITGYIDDVIAYVKRFDIFILFSDFESLPCSIMEAMSCGCPVLASNVGGIPEIISNEYNGILVDKGDTKKLYEQIVYLIENDAIRNYLGNNAKSTIKNNFPLEKMVQSIERDYCMIINRKLNHDH